LPGPDGAVFCAGRKGKRCAEHASRCAAPREQRRSQGRSTRGIRCRCFAGKNQASREERISAHQRDLWLQTTGVRFVCQRADLRAFRGQLRKHMASNVAGAPDDEDTIHSRTSCLSAHLGLVGDGCSDECFGGANASRATPIRTSTAEPIKKPVRSLGMWSRVGGIEGPEISWCRRAMTRMPETERCTRINVVDYERFDFA
jgi:hypothetical protein